MSLRDAQTIHVLFSVMLAVCTRYSVILLVSAAKLRWLELTCLQVRIYFIQGQKLRNA